jgi:hypothetical protein
MDGMGGIIKAIAIAGAFIFVLVLIVGFVAYLWPLWLALAIVGIPSFMYWKSQKRKQNMV